MAFLYLLPSDDVTSSGSLSLDVGSVDATYPTANVKNDNLARPAKFTSTAVRLVWDFGGAIALRCLFVFHTTLDASAGLMLMAHTSNAWGAPDFSTQVSTLGLASDNFSKDTYIRDTNGSWAAKRFWAFQTVNANGVNIKYGRIFISTTSVRSLTRNFHYDDFGPERGHPDVVHQCMGATLQYRFGTRTEIISGSIPCDATDYAALKTLFDVATGGTGGTAFPIVLDSTGTTPFISASEALFVRFAPGYRFAPQFRPSVATGLMNVPVAFKVVDRGLVL